MPSPTTPILDTEIERTSRGPRTALRLFVDCVLIGAVALIVILPFKYFIAQPFIVEGDSMLPGLAQNDYLIIDELTYLTKPPQRGDVVVFRYPLDPSLFFIKRLIGLPGETIDIRDGSVTVQSGGPESGVVLVEPYVQTENQKVDDSTIVLGPDEFFMLGDNRKASFDSRVWGPVSRRNIVGRAWMRIFPIAHAQMMPVTNATSTQ